MLAVWTLLVHCCMDLAGGFAADNGGRAPALGLEGYQYKGKVKFVDQAASGVELDLKAHDVSRLPQKSDSILGESATAGTQHATLLVTREGHLYHKRYAELQWSQCMLIACILSRSSHIFILPVGGPALSGGRGELCQGVHVHPCPASTSMHLHSCPGVSHFPLLAKAFVSAVPPALTLKLFRLPPMSFFYPSSAQTWWRVCCVTPTRVELL